MMGLKNAGIIVANKETLVSIGNLTSHSVLLGALVRPIAGASATGRLAKIPIRMLPKAAIRQVVTNTAWVSIPAAPRICGLTKTMYTIVRKVVNPAITSVRALVPCSRNLNARRSQKTPLLSGTCHFLSLRVGSLSVSELKEEKIRRYPIPKLAGDNANHLLFSLKLPQ